MADDPAPYELPDERVAAAWRRLLEHHLVGEPLEPGFAEELRRRGVTRVAELGAATAPISALLQPQGVECVALDLNPPRGRRLDPTVQGDLRHLPFAGETFDAVTLVNCLYFVSDPHVAIGEAWRILRPGGTLLASAPNRKHDPELRHVLDRWGEPSPFDGEDAEAIVRAALAAPPAAPDAGIDPDVDVRPWEAVGYHLPDRRAVVDYLVAFKHADPEAKAERTDPPLDVTKSGCDVWVTKPHRREGADGAGRPTTGR